MTIDGEVRELRCRVRSVDGFSADAGEPGLLAWIGGFARGKHPADAGFPRQVFVVHGDPGAQRALEPKIRALGFTTRIPTWRERATLS